MRPLSFSLGSLLALGALGACGGSSPKPDPVIDERCEDGSKKQIWYQDLDGDEWGDPEVSVLACEGPRGWETVAGDCDDEDAGSNPEEVERCDGAGADEDCDGLVDDADDSMIDDSTTATWLDQDGDGYGAAGDFTRRCVVPAGEVANDADCDDADDSVNPAAVEHCDEADVDENCDGRADNNDPSVDATEFVLVYQDQDEDGFGDGLETLWRCDPPEDYVLIDGDCDDEDASVNPDASEVCDALDTDEDCDGLVDDGDDSVDPASLNHGYRDLDGDGFGDPLTETVACEIPTDLIYNGDDCNDTNGQVNPDVPERCDEMDDDQDCDGLADDADTEAENKETYYPDLDGDGYGDAASATQLCDPPEDYLENGLDCDDTDPTRYPDADPICEDEFVNDCSGTVFEEEDYCLTPNSHALSATDAKLTGEGSGDAAGSSIALLGDTDGDGLPELLIGAPSFGSSNTGAAYVVTGLTTGTATLSASRARLTTSVSSATLGSGVADPGDMDGDGYADILVGAPYYTGSATKQGAAWLIPGPVSGSLTLTEDDLAILGDAKYDYLGTPLVGADDVDGDGWGDLLLGANPGGRDDGQDVYLMAGPISAEATIDDAVASVLGAEADTVATALAGGEDLDGDGFSDFVLGAYSASTLERDAGAVYIALGPVSGALVPADIPVIVHGEDASDYAGRSVSVSEDVDGDGYPDLLVGATGESSVGSNAGAAYLVLGPLDRSAKLDSADAKLAGYASSVVGGSVRLVSDLNGDGLGELLVGGTASSSRTASGYGFLFYGPVSGAHSVASADLEITTSTALDYLGVAVTSGDLDGDGLEELILGASGDDGSGGAAGAVWVLFGAGL